MTVEVVPDYIAWLEMVATEKLVEVYSPRLNLVRIGIPARTARPFRSKCSTRRRVSNCDQKIPQREISKARVWITYIKKACALRLISSSACITGRETESSMKGDQFVLRGRMWWPQNTALHDLI